MYGHIYDVGFGFRMLIDLYNLINNNVIEWSIVVKWIKEHKLERFSYAMLKMVYEIGELELPRSITLKIGAVEEEYFNLLKQDILLSGNMGKADTSKYLSGHIADYSSSTSIWGKICFVFPNKKYLLKRPEFQYAKNTLLIPFAWGHRIMKHVVSGNMKNRYVDKKLIEDRIKLKRWIVENDS
jgi:hypothetical protein